MSETTPVSIASLLGELIEELTQAGIENPHVDAEIIVGSVLGKSRGRIRALALLDREVDERDAAHIRNLGEDRAQRIPLQHLTGRAPFRNIELLVGPGVFIPRPETETVVQLAVDELNADVSPEPLVVDLCTGSGAIALSIAHEVDRARVWAIEKDEHAHAWAERNVADLGGERVTLIQGDILSDHTQLLALRGKLSVIITNPPYVPQSAIPRDPEVRDHDPHLALFSGEDGLELIRKLSKKYREYLRPGGLLVIEHAEMQGNAVRKILESDGWHGPSTHRDLTLRDRATTARA